MLLELFCVILDFLKIRATDFLFRNKPALIGRSNFNMDLKMER